MMLEELSLLFASTDAEATFDTYRSAILNDNVLLKTTESTKAKSFRYLRELYGLKQQMALFRVLRMLWPSAIQSKPQLALLCAVARDPLLRSTVGRILETPAGTSLSDEDFSGAVQEELGAHLNPNILGKAGRNIASSWTQSGHLIGRTGKVRKMVQADPISTAYALFLAYLTGYRGDTLFESDWARLLDAPPHVLREYAQHAAQQGWLEYRHSGTITEITFRFFQKE